MKFVCSNEKRSFGIVTLAFCFAIFMCANQVNAAELQNYLERPNFSAPDQDVWVFNTRTASWTNPNECQLHNITVHRLDRAPDDSRATWNRSTVDAFCESSSPEIPTIILIHGNQTSFQEGIESGFHFEQHVLRRKICDDQTGECGTRRYRLLIWCWPADRPTLRISLKDAKRKAFYSEHQAEYVAQILRRFPQESRVCLVGFSYGARTICEALEQLERREPQTFQALSIRNLLLAPAVDQVLTAPHRKYGKVISETEQTMLLYNTRDSALRWYSCIYGCGKGNSSLGREGFPGVARSHQTTAYDISPMVGRKHSFLVMFLNASLNQKLAQFVFFES